MEKITLTPLQIEKTLSKEGELSSQDKTVAVTLDAIAKEEASVLPLTQALENRDVVNLPVKSKKLVTVLKTIAASGGTVGKLPDLDKLSDNDFIEALKAAPYLKEVAIPKHFTKFDQLETLLNKDTLEKIKLTDVSPKNLDFLKDYSKLWHFRATWTTIQSENWDFLSHLSSLEDFYVYDTNFKKLEFLEKLNNLKKVSIKVSKTKDWSGLLLLPSVETLHLISSEFADTSLLKNMTKLKELQIVGCPIKDWSGLTQLSSLEDLFISACEFSDTSVLQNMTKLKTLTLDQCPITNWSGLLQLLSVETVNIRRCGFSDTSVLKNMTRLITLEAYGCTIIDWSGLSSLTSLEWLNLSETNFSDLSILQNCSRLSRLNLDGCPELKDLGPIANLPSLRIVHLAGLPETVDTSILDEILNLTVEKPQSGTEKSTSAPATSQVAVE